MSEEAALANPLTGDFDAVLQVSESTINRLMATLHQNAGTQKDEKGKQLPGHPHAISIRIRPEGSVDGVGGRLDAQLGVPRVVFVDRVTDRFQLEFNVRARFFAAEGSAYLPMYMHGVVRATYEIHPIDPSCPGWKKNAADYFWARIMKDTVQFRGTTDDDSDSSVVSGPAEVNARIERVVAYLLDYRFEVAPQRVERLFRPGRMRSLKAGSVDALAVPISLSGEEPTGQTSSIEQVFVADHDFAVAVNGEWLMSQVQPYVDQLRTPLQFSTTNETTFGPFDVWELTYTFSVRVTQIEVTWEGDDDPWGRLRIKAAGEVVNMTNNANGVVSTFTIEDQLTLDFNASAEALRILHRGSPDLRVSGLPQWARLFLPNSHIEALLRNAVNNGLGNLPSVSLAPQKSELVTQLRKLAGPTANANFVTARFVADGVILRGRVALASRNRPVVQFEKSDDNNSFDALASWAPGGWIERYLWKWEFDFQSEESRTVSDRCVLSRPPVVYSRWGKPILADGEKPLPGLDGWGWMCLEIHGFQVDSLTGRRVPFVEKTCTHYGHRLSVGGFDFASRLLGALHSGAIDGAQPREIGLIELGGAPVDRAAANSMVFYSGGRFDREAANIVAAGLDASAREDAGLVILALVREGAALEGGAALTAEIAAFTNRIGAHVEVVEDVARSWTRRLAIPPDLTAWRLITPNGGFSWSHDGQLAPEELGRALNVHLRPSPPPHLRPIVADIAAAKHFPPLLIGDNSPDRKCPGFRFVPVTPASVGVIFAKAGSRSSELQLAIAARIWRQHPENAQDLVVVLDGDEQQAEELAHTYPEFELIPDLNGDIADRCGIRIWPTTVAVDAGGVVTGVRQGVYEFDEPTPTSEELEERSAFDAPTTRRDPS